MEKKTLLLVGGGHANVGVIKAFADEPNVRVVCVSDTDRPYYSGMMPGCIAGIYTEDETRIDVAKLGAWSGAEIIRGRATDMDPDARTLTYITEDDDASFNAGEDTTPSTHTIRFDVAVVDVGSTVRSIDDVPGAGQFAVATRPLSNILPGIERYERECEEAQQFNLPPAITTEEQAIEGNGPDENTAAVIPTASSPATSADAVGSAKPFFKCPPIVVVGAGAAGIEIAFTVEARVRKRFGDAAAPQVTLIASDPERLLVDKGNWTSSKVEQVMCDRGISVERGVRVDRVDPASNPPAGEEIAEDRLLDDDTEVTQASGQKLCHVRLSNGQTILNVGLLIWATGAAPRPLMTRLGVEICERGYMLCRTTLQSTSHDHVLGAGDCITIQGHPHMPKAGVYAVRETPILIDNARRLLRAAEGDEPTLSLREYSPQSGFLTLLATGDGKAIGSYKGIAMHSSLVWKLKDSIDRKFMDEYNADKLPPKR